MPELEQLQLFKTEKEPVTGKHLNMASATLTPKETNACLRLLGVNYSLEPVEGWVSVRHLSGQIGADTHALTEWKQIAWVDPSTISLLLGTRGLDGRWVTSWGFGPTYELGTGALSKSLTGETEVISFLLTIPGDYDWVEPLTEVGSKTA